MKKVNNKNMLEGKKKKYYKQKICEMLKEIENLTDIEMIYGMTKVAHENIAKAEV